MKSFTISIQDDKEEIFIELMKSISFVKNIKKEISTEISQKQKEIVRQRMQKYEESPESFLQWEEIERKIQL